MCRTVFVVVLFSLISCVLSEPKNNTAKHDCISNNKNVQNANKAKDSCFADVVNFTLLGETGRRCKNASDFGDAISAYYKTVDAECETHITMNKESIVNFVNFSLSNGTFKEMITNDVSCVKSKEVNISNCVRTHVGFFNETKDHLTKWYRKQKLVYNARTCYIGHEVKSCVELHLNSCQATTRAFVSSLFSYALQKCNEIDWKIDISASTTVNPDPSGSNKPIIIGSSVGVVLLIIAIVVAVLCIIRRR